MLLRSLLTSDVLTNVAAAAIAAGVANELEYSLLERPWMYHHIGV